MGSMPKADTLVFLPVAVIKHPDNLRETGFVPGCSPSLWGKSRQREQEGVGHTLSVVRKRDQ